jgi:hypothetical protein
MADASSTAKVPQKQAHQELQSPSAIAPTVETTIQNGTPVVALKLLVSEPDLQQPGRTLRPSAALHDLVQALVRENTPKVQHMYEDPAACRQAGMFDFITLHQSKVRHLQDSNVLARQ